MEKRSSGGKRSTQEKVISDDDIQEELRNFSRGIPVREHGCFYTPDVTAQVGRTRFGLRVRRIHRQQPARTLARLLACVCASLPLAHKKVQTFVSCGILPLINIVKDVKVSRTSPLICEGFILLFIYFRVGVPAKVHRSSSPIASCEFLATPDDMISYLLRVRKRQTSGVGMDRVPFEKVLGEPCLFSAFGFPPRRPLPGQDHPTEYRHSL